MEMEEQKIVERPLMNEEEFKDYMEKNRGDIVGDFYEKGILHLRTYEVVNKIKSVRRAIKRGRVSLDGIIFPKRPFSNKANTCKRRGHHSRTFNERKKMIYEQLKTEKQLNDYDEVPVLYCNHCLSLKIRNIPRMEDSDYCDECGSTDIGECSIKEWETLYEKRYGHKFLEEY